MKFTTVPGACLCLLLLISACQTRPQTHQITSPDQSLDISVYNTGIGTIGYQAKFKGQTVIDTSWLSIDFHDAPTLDKELLIKEVRQNTHYSTWEPVWGEDAQITDHYNEQVYSIEEREPPYRRLELSFRVYDEGFAFRYHFPMQEGMDSVIISDEHSEFRMTGDHSTWWIPADYDSYEYLYTESLLSEVDGTKPNGEALASKSIINPHAVNTPVTMRTNTGLYLSIHEANLTNYAGMTLRIAEDKRTLTSELVPNAQGHKVVTKAPFSTPWRMVQVAEQAGDLVESHMILNLNEPSVIEDPGWISPMKYMGIWWEMHLEKSTWYAGDQHGATTAHAKELIDFAAASGFQGLLVEGWNTGWEHWRDDSLRRTAFDFTTPYPDFDLEEVSRYGQERGVALIGHHETSAVVTQYEARLDSAFALYASLGVPAIKTGYVGFIEPANEYHHGQYMVNHYRRVIQKAAESGISIVAHEPIKPTGLRRTYPNFLAREGVRGSEFNAPWGGGNPPEHLTILPFTRMLAGPIDYTPGIFKLDLDEYRPGYGVPTTLAYQLAAYVIIYSPVQMASDLQEHYEGEPAFQFIKDVPVDWASSKVLDAAIGDYVVIARKDKASDDWYLGAVTDEDARTLTIDLSFLETGRSYKAMIYADAADAHYQTNKSAYVISNRELSSGDQLALQLAPGGGQAIRFEAIRD